MIRRGILMRKLIRHITIHPLFFLCLAWIVLTDSTFHLLAIASAIFLHECGHVVVYAMSKICIDEIRLQPFGVRISPDPHVHISYRVQGVCAVAGPTMNFICVGICFALSHILLFPQWLTTFYAASLFLGLFNMLPIVPMDGGRFLYAIIAGAGYEYAAQRISAICGFICGLALLIFGTVVLVQSQMNLSLCILSSYMLICLSVKVYQFQKKRKPNAKSKP